MSIKKLYFKRQYTFSYRSKFSDKKNIYFSRRNFIFLVLVIPEVEDAHSSENVKRSFKDSCHIVHIGSTLRLEKFIKSLVTCKIL